MPEGSDDQLVGQGTLPGVQVPLDLDWLAVQQVHEALIEHAAQLRLRAGMAREENWKLPSARDEAAARALRLDRRADRMDRVRERVEEALRRFDGS